MPSSPFLPGICTTSTRSRTSSLSGATISSSSVSAIVVLRLCRFHLLGFFQHFVDGALHVERLFWNIVALAIHDLLEAAHRVLDLHVASLNASKLLSNVEGLRQELLDLAGARHRELLVFAEFVDTENRDDVLQVLVALQHALNGLRRVVVLLAHDARIENARSGSQRI